MHLYVLTFTRFHGGKVTHHPVPNGMPLWKAPSVLLRTSEAGIIRFTVNLVKDVAHEHCPIHGCVEYVCCEPV